jgi:transcriptional regulator with XRE-family HTH domain
MANKTAIVATTGERLAEALKMRHMNAAELSKLTGLSKSTISYYLKNKFTPQRDKILLMAQYLRVSPDWLEGTNVDIDNKESENIATKDSKTSPLRIQVLSPAVLNQLQIEGLSSSKQQFIAEASNYLCNLAQETLISPEDRELLDKFHALAPDSKALIISMIEKLSGQEAPKKEEGEIA